eukprot:2505558-Karenia_brevis.AAC.1
MKIPLNTSPFLDVYSGDGDHNTQALGQMFDKMKLHKREFPFAYPKKYTDPPPGTPRVSFMPTEGEGALLASFDPEHAQSEEIGVQATTEPAEEEPVPRGSHQSGSS